jgi:putative Holliday junction resolvase
MGKIIGLDFGTKRIGVAISDALHMIATPVETIPAKDLIEYLKMQDEEIEVDGLVLGLPKGLDGKPTNSTQQVLDLEKHLKRTFPDWFVQLEDERFTSKIARMALVQGNMPKAKRREKGAIDKVSAAIILQSFLDQSP